MHSKIVQRHVFNQIILRYFKIGHKVAKFYYLYEAMSLRPFDKVNAHSDCLASRDLGQSFQVILASLPTLGLNIRQETDFWNLEMFSHKFHKFCSMKWTWVNLVWIMALNSQVEWLRCKTDVMNVLIDTISLLKIQNEANVLKLTFEDLYKFHVILKLRIEATRWDIIFSWCYITYNK